MIRATDSVTPRVQSLDWHLFQAKLRRQKIIPMCLQQPHDLVFIFVSYQEYLFYLIIVFTSLSSPYFLHNETGIISNWLKNYMIFTVS